jgi:hypothetical protein
MGQFLQEILENKKLNNKFNSNLLKGQIKIILNQSLFKMKAKWIGSIISLLIRIIIQDIKEPIEMSSLIRAEIEKKQIKT